MNLKTIVRTLMLSALASLAIAGTPEHSLIDSTKLSEAEVQQIVTNPQNQQRVELVMSILKAIDDLNITENSKKIDFVNTMEVSDNIKTLVKNQINLNITYSDFQRVSYGIYRLMSKQCGKISGSGDALPDYILFQGYCVYQEYYTC
jgi:hypothetical protein